MIVFLLENGDVVKIDDFKTPKYSTVWKAHNFDMIAIDIDISSNGSIVLCTRSGSVFIRSGTTTSSSATMMSSSTSELLIGGRRGSLTESSLNISNGNKFKKIDNLNKIVRVSCDAQFLSFGFIRDEVDMIPLKLHKNSFFNDLMHLELNQASNLYRKQDELFIPDGPGNSYIKDFVFYKQKIKRKKVEDMFTGLTIDEDEDNDEEIEDESSEICDLYYKKHKERYSSQYKEVKSKHTYQKLSKLDRQVMFDDLKFKLEVNLIEMFDSKRFNCFIVVPEFPDIKIGIHKFIFMERSRFCWNIFQPEEPGEYFKFENITGRFDPESNEIQFNSHVNLKSLLIMIHFLYTNDVLSIWDDYPLGIHCPKDIKEIKTDFEMLVRLFQLSDVYGKLSKDEVYLKKMRQMYDSEIECDVVVELCDGTIACHSPILVTRSAYFETLLSNRWDDGEVVEKIIKFDNISQLHFDIVLKHLYGVSDTTIFSELMKEVKEIDEFINNILDLIEISDELLIFELKLLCELAIKDFINIDNVLILLQHSNFLSANKLFMNCCWFIYNNLEILLLDHSFKDLPLEILKKLEKQIDFISDCKLKSFEGSGVVYENWYEKIQINWFHHLLIIWINLMKIS